MTKVAVAPAAVNRPVGRLGRLAELEQIIERGLKTFVEVGHALLEIRINRLYAPEYPTFEKYCRARWEPKLSRQHAHRLIQAARVADVLSPMGDVLTSEGQARELVPLLGKPAEMQAVMLDVRKAVDDVQQQGPKSVTAAIIREEVQKRVAPPGASRADTHRPRHPQTHRKPKRAPHAQFRNPMPIAEIENLITTAHDLAVAITNLKSKRADRVPAHVFTRATKLLDFLRTKRLWTGGRAA